MYVCICKKVTDGDIQEAVYSGEVNSLRQIRKKLGACTQCGKCSGHAKEVLQQCQQEIIGAAGSTLPVLAAS